MRNQIVSRGNHWIMVRHQAVVLDLKIIFINIWRQFMVSSVSLPFNLPEHCHQGHLYIIMMNISQFNETKQRLRDPYLHVFYLGIFMFSCFLNLPLSTMQFLLLIHQDQCFWGQIEPLWVKFREIVYLLDLLTLINLTDLFSFCFCPRWSLRPWGWCGGGRWFRGIHRLFLPQHW